MDFTIRKKEFLFAALIIALLNGCGEDNAQVKPAGTPYPAHPNYAIIKPKVRFTPSRENLAKMIRQLQGAPYVWAEEGPDKFDCSGFTYYLYGSMGIELPRVARKQARVGKKVRFEELQYGDLLFFATGKHNRRKITHVGVYLGNGWFTHASTVKHKVTYTNLYEKPYYLERLRICRRYLPDADNATTRLSSAIPTPKRDPFKAAKEIGASLEKSAGHKAVILPDTLAKQSRKVRHYVQVGSFRGKPKMHLLYRLKEQGYHYKIIRFNDGNGEVNKLLVGPYLSKDDARRVLEKMRITVEPNAFLADIE